ncbi:MAG TPA: hypothetical protein PLH19_00150 [Anaerolineae bacterium]|nr:hypothetical protein [Anaerolineae bacterium]HQH36932.1 hypothetical protein [Anaerolineae bacterium]
MNDPLQSENRSALAGIASTITFPYLWFSLFVGLWWLYRIGFFGRDWGSILMLVVLGLVCLIPAVPLALTRFVLRPLFSNLLAREVISHAGCVTGLVSIVLAGFAAIYGLSRGAFETTLLFLLAVPVVGVLLAGGVSLVQRSGFRSPVSRRRSAPAAPPVEKPAPTALPGARKPSMISVEDRPALPPASSRPAALPAPRRSADRPAMRTPGNNEPAPRRAPPPRRKP